MFISVLLLMFFTISKPLHLKITFFLETSRSMDFHKTWWGDGGIWEQLTLIVILGRCTMSPPIPCLRARMWLA